jgi:phospholipid/cholesterol/gamma-HCH transport system substrate-binding protein
MKDRTKSILIAVSFIVAMVLFVWGFNFLKGKSILNNQYNFYAVYNNSKGLLPGDLVTINGMQVGTVSSLKFHPKQDGSIVVEFTTNNKLNIPDNSVVKLSSSLMGSVSLNLILGNSDVFAQSGDTLMAALDNGAMDMVAETIMPLKDNLETLLVSLNDLTSNLNDLLNQGLKNSINEGVSSFASSMNNIETISSDLQQLVDSNDGKLTMVVNNLETITDNFGVVSDSLKNIDYNHLVLSLENCLAEFNTLMTGINEGEGSIGRLVKEDSLYYNVNEAIFTLQSILKEIQEDPKKIKLSVF